MSEQAIACKSQSPQQRDLSTIQVALVFLETKDEGNGENVHRSAASTLGEDAFCSDTAPNHGIMMMRQSLQKLD
jgi:hypothetical protein